MAAINVFLDTRRAVAGGLYPIKISIYHNNKQRNIPLGLAVELNQWKEGRIVSHPQRVVWNNMINRRLADFNDALAKVAARRIVRLLTCEQLKEEIIKELDPLAASSVQAAPEFLPILKEYANMCRAQRTKNIYLDTHRSITKYLDASHQDKLITFPAITRKWLIDYDQWLESNGNKTNARGIHMRNIRAVFNHAIKEDIISLDIYPFKKFQIRTEATFKRSLSRNDIIKLFAFKPTRKYDVMAYDIFKLTFYLIGINFIDLFNLKAANYINGRIQYKRSKTGRLYDIAVLPQAAEIIEKYRAPKEVESLLLFKGRNIGGRLTYDDYSSLLSVVNEHLHIIAERLSIPTGLTTYWARHSWATIAADLEIPKETISAALGHGGDSVTDIYIDFNAKKVDEANRRVVAEVLKATPDGLTLEERLKELYNDEECPF